MAENTSNSFNASAEADKTAKAIADDVATYSKDYFTKGGRFDFLSRSIFNLVLKEGVDYTLDQAKAKIADFKKEVN